MIFVFGSNLSGRHGKGAAKDAVEKHGAVYGQAKGRQGNSYAIPTKDEQFKTLSIEEISGYVNNFLEYAKKHQDEIFYVTPVGTGLAGLHIYQIAPLFKNAPQNCVFANTWFK